MKNSDTQWLFNEINYHKRALSREKDEEVKLRHIKIIDIYETEIRKRLN